MTSGFLLWPSKSFCSTIERIAGEGDQAKDPIQLHVFSNDPFLPVEAMLVAGFEGHDLTYSISCVWLWSA